MKKVFAQICNTFRKHKKQIAFFSLVLIGCERSIIEGIGLDRIYPNLRTFNRANPFAVSGFAFDRDSHFLPVNFSLVDENNYKLVSFSMSQVIQPPGPWVRDCAIVHAPYSIQLEFQPARLFAERILQAYFCTFQSELTKKSKKLYLSMNTNLELKNLPGPKSKDTVIYECR